jgi:Tol biopolymer transport system component
VYPASLKDKVAETAAIAESSYQVLSDNLNYTFDNRLTIYLSDRDEIVNGFATPLETTFIWVNLNGYIDAFTDEDKWLRKVIAHELTHLFHFEITQSNIGLLEYLFNEPMPRFWSEGLAQYETETWNAQRGDRWLRMAVFDDALSYSDGTSIDAGKLLYATGHSQVRFFAEQYGDTTLTNMLHYKKSLGPIKYHDFEKAWEKHTGNSYNHFSDRWQKHINVFYNTMASRYQRTDSLAEDGNKLPLPGQFVFDLTFAPDTSQYVVLSQPSIQRPVRQLILVQHDSSQTTTLLTEGVIQGDIAWSPDGKYLSYSRPIRTSRGNIIPQLFLLNLDTQKEIQITDQPTLRATSPTLFQPDTSQQHYHLAFIGHRNGVSNIYLGRLSTDGSLNHLQATTDFQSDTELSDLSWSPDGRYLLSDIFTAERQRGLLVVDLSSHEQHILYRAGTDDRDPVWSPDGSQIAFNSLQDKVPNIWTYQLDKMDQPPVRRTAIFTGAELMDWISADSLHPQGRWVVSSTESKSKDQVFLVDARRQNSLPYQPHNDIPESYRRWQAQTPPQTIDKSISADPALIQETKPYRAFKEWQHVATFGLPYVDSNDKLGLFFTTTFQEPLNKHVFSLTGGISTSDFEHESWGIATYINNTLYPSLVFSGYQLPGSIRFYGNDLLVERQRGGDITGLWPHNINRPYARARSAFRLRHINITPRDYSFSGSNPPQIAQPEKGQITDLSYSFTYRQQKPYAYNLVHPLDGLGIRLSLTGAVNALGSDAEFIRPELAAYGILPGLGKQRLFLYGKLQAQWGNSLTQDYIGFSKYDNIQIPLPVEGFEVFGRNERVRGYRDFVAGEKVAFGSVEYRIPLMTSLQTKILGFLSFGATTLSVFSDAGVVWKPTYQTGQQVQQWGSGVELKNQVRIGPITFTHNVGWARPSSELIDGNDDWYYRLRAAVPF